MMSTMLNPGSTRPEYSRLERLLDIAVYLHEEGQSEKAVEPLERYLRWNANDSHAVAVRDEIYRSLGRTPAKALPEA